MLVVSSGFWRPSLARDGDLDQARLNPGWPVAQFTVHSPAVFPPVLVQLVRVSRTGRYPTNCDMLYVHSSDKKYHWS
jgi:hypothetical protein